MTLPAPSHAKPGHAIYKNPTARSSYSAGTKAVFESLCLPPLASRVKNFFIVHPKNRFGGESLSGLWQKQTDRQIFIIRVAVQSNKVSLHL